MSVDLVRTCHAVSLRQMKDYTASCHMGECMAEIKSVWQVHVGYEECRCTRKNPLSPPPIAKERGGGAHYIAKQPATQVRFSRDVGRSRRDGRWLEGTRNRKQAYVRAHRDITTHGQIIVASPEEGGTLSGFLAICGPEFGVPML